MPADSWRYPFLLQFLLYRCDWVRLSSAGGGLGLIYLPAIVSVTCYFEKKRSFATGIAVCGSGIGECHTTTLHNGTKAGIIATFRISLTSTDLTDTYLTWFRIVQ